jgi:hypothetical protein
MTNGQASTEPKAWIARANRNGLALHLPNGGAAEPNHHSQCGAHNALVTFEVVPGVYWTEENEERVCFIVLFDGRIMAALDHDTLDLIPDAPAAIRTT